MSFCFSYRALSSSWQWCYVCWGSLSKRQYREVVQMFMSERCISFSFLGSQNEKNEGEKLFFGLKFYSSLEERASWAVAGSFIFCGLSCVCHEVNGTWCPVGLCLLGWLGDPRKSVIFIIWILLILFFFLASWFWKTCGA